MKETPTIYDVMIAGEAPDMETALVNLIDAARAAITQFNSMGAPAPAQLGIAIEQARWALRKVTGEVPE